MFSLLRVDGYIWINSAENVVSPLAESDKNVVLPGYLIHDIIYIYVYVCNRERGGALEFATGRGFGIEHYLNTDLKIWVLISMIYRYAKVAQTRFATQTV